MVTVKTNRNIIQDNNYSNCCGCSGIDGDYSNVGGVIVKENTQPTGGGAKEEPKMRGVELPEFVATSSKAIKDDKTKTDNTSNKSNSKLSTTTKVLIGLGIALVLGASIYFITKKK